MWNEFLKKVDVNSYNGKIILMIICLSFSAVNFEPKSLEDLRKQSINAIYTAYSNNTLLVVRGLPSETVSGFVQKWKVYYLFIEIF